ncbi:MAG: cobalt-precorrin-5B (C(1))-methyltransferase CbiD [Eubacteriales bacterium]
MDSFIIKDGKKLKRGYTTGSCAAAASKAAALMLLGGQRLESVRLLTPRGIWLTLAIAECDIGGDYVFCGVQKDSGDDPDVTNGIVIYARVEKTAEQGIVIEGGDGIGRVTKPGLDQPPGAAAINSTPRRMIEAELMSVIEDFGFIGGLRVTISAPAGAEIAKKTFNPRLGIVGGISILGTTGIVEPMSDDAVVETIRTELNMRRAAGARYVLLTPGNYGADYIRNTLGLNPESAVTTSNFIGDAFSAAAEAGFEGALLVGHIGKLVKLAGGIFNTHSRFGDCRAEIFAAHAAMAGADSETIRRLMDSAMTDDMLDILASAGLREKVMLSIAAKTEFLLGERHLGSMSAAMITFSNKYGFLASTPNAFEILEKLRSVN